MTDAIAQNGHEMIAAGSKSFALASRLFDAELRSPVAELYAWCRYCDDMVDGQHLGHDQKAANRHSQQKVLDRLHARTECALAGKPDDDPIFQGLARVISTHGIAPRYPRELLQGFEMDVRQRVYQDEEDLLEYCYHVAGVVGIMMARIMGAQESRTLDRACDLGLAFQLTNIARDVVEDARAGRVYVPLSLLRRHHAPTAAVALAQPENWPRLHAAVLDLLQLAERYYRSAFFGLPQLPFRCAWAVNAALKIYRDIGNKIRQQGPDVWGERIATSNSRKLILTMAALPVGVPSEEQPRSPELFCRPGRK